MRQIHETSFKADKEDVLDVCLLFCLLLFPHMTFASCLLGIRFPQSLALLFSSTLILRCSRKGIADIELPWCTFRSHLPVC